MGGGGPAEQWLTDHKKATGLGEKLQAEIRKRNEDLAANPNGAAGQGKKAAQLRGQEFRNFIQRMWPHISDTGV